VKRPPSRQLTSRKVARDGGASHARGPVCYTLQSERHPAPRHPDPHAGSAPRTAAPR